MKVNNKWLSGYHLSGKRTLLHFTTGITLWIKEGPAGADILGNQTACVDQKTKPFTENQQKNHCEFGQKWQKPDEGANLVQNCRFGVSMPKNP